MATYSAPPTPLSLAYSRSEYDAAPDWSARIPALDGLRGVAILLVLGQHAIFGLESNSAFVNRLVAIGRLSWSGVDLFFVLSGFLIGGILLDAQESPRYYTTFYARRAYRILLLYFIFTAAFLLRHIPRGLLPRAFGPVSPLTIPWASYLTFSQIFFTARLGWYGPPAMAVTWSLAVEEQFYLVIPFAIRKIRGGRLPVALLAVITTAALLRLVLLHTVAHGAYACYVLMPCRADALCLGVLSAYLVRRPAVWKHLLARRNLLLCATGILFIGMAVTGYWGYDARSLAKWGYSITVLFYTSCLLAAVSSSSGWWHSVLCQPWLIDWERWHIARICCTTR